MITWLLNFFATLKPSQPIQPLARQQHASRSIAHPTHAKTADLEKTGALKSPLCRTATLGTTGKTKPLRIIQWVESASTTHPSNRRMVMSGRLADICAELDRLAAMESA